ncbi:MAG TPA: DUF1634 domain-containing protein [Terracidiphilus sp.]|nr:DUF1634 domain-containing protein [Terracidiphilus sp.]
MDDKRLQSFIGNLLRAGVLLAAAIVFAGAVLYLFQHHADKVAYENFHAESPSLSTLAGIVNSAFHLDSAGLMQFGLLLLIATPVARVVLAAVGFYLERDYLYVTVSLIVLGILLFSMLNAT